MSTHTMPAMADGFAARLPAVEYTVAETLRSQWMTLRKRVMRLSARRRLARSIAHLDDRLLADAGLAPEQRGLSDHLIRHISAASEILTGINARRG